MYQVWEGDLYLFSVDDQYEADVYAEQGFRIVGIDLS